MTEPTKEEEIALVLEWQEKARNIDRLKTHYKQSCDPNTESGKLNESFKDHAMAIYDRVVPELLKTSKIFVMPLPACLIHDPINNEVIPVAAKSERVKSLWRSNLSDDENIANISDELILQYSSMLLPELHPEGCTADVVGIYQLLIPVTLVPDPTSDETRTGFITRYSKYRFSKKKETV